MGEQRRGYVMLIRRGDPEITAAGLRGLLEGAMVLTPPGPSGHPPLSGEARGPHPSVPTALPPERFAKPTAPQTGEGFGEPVQHREQVEIVTAEADQWKTVAKLVKVAVGNTKTPEDYEIMLIKAKADHSTAPAAGPMHVVGGKLLLAWAMLCQGIRNAYRAQDRVLK